jgi:hypothetical protein
MRHGVLFTASMVAALLTIPAFASPCADDIRALEVRVNEASSKTAALSGGGEGVAASRQAQAMQADARPSQSGEPVQKLPEHDVNATAAVTPLAGGDKTMKAKAALDRARALDREGNAVACTEALTEAKRELAPAQ